MKATLLMPISLWRDHFLASPPNPIRVLLDLDRNWEDLEPSIDAGSLISTPWSDSSFVGLAVFPKGRIVLEGVDGLPSPGWRSLALSLDEGKLRAFGRGSSVSAGDFGKEELFYISPHSLRRKMALQSGLKVCVSPLLLPEKVAGFDSYFLRVAHPACETFAALAEKLVAGQFAFIVHNIGPHRPSSVIGVAGGWTAERLDEAGFHVDRLGAAGDPDSRDLFLVRGAKRAVVDSHAPLPDAIRILSHATEERLVAVEAGLEDAVRLISEDPCHGPQLLRANLAILSPDWLPRLHTKHAKLFTIRESVVNASGPPLSQPEIQAFQQLNVSMFHGEMVPFIDWYSRHPLKEGNQQAVDAVRQRFSQLSLTRMDSAQSSPSYQTNANVKANVVAQLPGAGDLAGETIVIGCHLDSRNYDEGENYRAPGMDDDVSGMAGVFCAARVLQALASQQPLRPRRTIQFAFFNMEEYHCAGSDRWVKHAPDIDSVLAMVQLDMISCRPSPLENRWQVHIGKHEAVAEPFLAGASRFMAEIAGLVRGQLAANVLDPLANELILLPGGGSDHLRYHSVGTPACALSEYLIENGRYLNEQWHKSTDTFDKIEDHLDYGAAIARVAAGLVWVLATR